jgi:hypothetical protein
MAKPTPALLKRLKPWQVLVVTWKDFHSMQGSFRGSQFFDESFSPCIRKTVGFYVGQNDEWLTVASTDDRNAGTGVNDIEDLTVFIIAGIVDIQVLE